MPEIWFETTQRLKKWEEEQRSNTDQGLVTTEAGW